MRRIAQTQPRGRRFADLLLTHALIAGACTFALVVGTILAYSALAQDACITDHAHPVDDRWSGTQRLALWPPAAMRCEWSTPTGGHVAWTITGWPLWMVYVAIALTAVAGVCVLAGRSRQVPGD